MIELKDSDGNVVAKIQSESPGQIQCKTGVWLTMKTEDDTEPTLCLVKTGDKAWYLGFYRDAKSSPVACDLAISFNKETGPMIQVAKGDEVEQIPLFDFVKDFSKKTGG